MIHIIKRKIGMTIATKKNVCGYWKILKIDIAETMVSEMARSVSLIMAGMLKPNTKNAARLRIKT